MALAIFERTVLVAAPEGPEGLTLRPGAAAAIRRCEQAGDRVAVIGEGVRDGQGRDQPAALAARQRELTRALDDGGAAVSAFLYCSHDDGTGCGCLSASGGLLQEAAARLDVPLEGARVFSDRRATLEAAIAKGARPRLLLTPAGIIARSEMGDSAPPSGEDLDALVAEALTD